MTLPRTSAPWQLIESDENAVRKLSEELSLHEALTRVLVRRGFSELGAADRFLRKSVSDLEDPFELSGMKFAVVRLGDALSRGERILVHGDFDADGITSAALLSLILRDLGGDVISFVPDRLIEGHGISLRAVELAVKQNVKLVVTCDCGVSSASEIEKLRSAQIETIVTDHHEVPSEIPAAIVVNPKLSDKSLDQSELSGVGVAFMLCVALRSHLREQGFFKDRAEPNLKQYLDIVALGTLADMAPLRGQNRILVAHGLEQIQRSMRPGLVAMRDSSGLKDSLTIDAEDVGYRLAPRINAAARLGHASDALELLITNEHGRARELAGKLESWNSERKQLESWMVRTATLEAERQVQEEKQLLIVASSDFHPGVIGLVAQRLTQIFHRPALVFSLQGEIAKGSGRSRGGLNLVELLEKCQELLIGFGGHKEAAGCSLESKRLPELRRRIDDALRNEKVVSANQILIDAKLNLGHVDERFLTNLSRLRPFGVGNPEPVFLARAVVAGMPKEVGKGHVRTTLRSQGGPSYSAVGFGLWESTASILRGEVDVAFTPEENQWKGKREIQLRLHGVRSV